MGTSEDDSSHSSFYSSFLKTDEGQTSSNEGPNECKGMEEMLWEKAPKTPLRRRDPHWLDNINVTNELIYRYQVNTRSLNDVLKADLFALKKVHQVSIKKTLKILFLYF